MPTWVRILLGLVAGVFLAGGSLGVVEMIAHQVSDGHTVFIFAAAGLGIGAFMGGSLANWIARDARIAWAVGGLLAALSLVNVFSFPHPVWFVPTGFTLVAIGAFAASRLIRPTGAKS